MEVSNEGVFLPDLLTWVGLANCILLKVCARYPQVTASSASFLYPGPSSTGFEMSA